MSTETPESQGQERERLDREFQAIEVLRTHIASLTAQLDALRAEIVAAREACPAVRMDRFANASLLELVNEQVSQLFRMQSRAEAAKSQVDAMRAENARQRAEDERVVRELMEWADRCPNAEGKGYIRSKLLPAAKSMLERWRKTP